MASLKLLVSQHGKVKHFMYETKRRISQHRNAFYFFEEEPKTAEERTCIRFSPTKYTRCSFFQLLIHSLPYFVEKDL